MKYAIETRPSDSLPWKIEVFYYVAEFDLVLMSYESCITRQPCHDWRLVEHSGHRSIRVLREHMEDRGDFHDFVLTKPRAVS